MKEKLTKLSNELEVHHGLMMRSLYATDASVYRQLPLAVAFPKNENEMIRLVQFANSNAQSLIVRTAGTSLAGQCVGEGIVVDMSKYWTNILELNVEERWVKVQPGVIRDELNRFLEPHGLFFSPNTSTSNRCMIGGMVGNNSSGSTSIRYGVTRDKVLSLRTILSDGTIADISKSTPLKKDGENTFMRRIEKQLYDILKDESVQENIRKEYPDAKVKRRNTGYALDELIKESIFQDEEGHWNLCKLMSGSEGTLGLASEITLRLDPLPPKLNMMLVVHYESIRDCLQSVLPLMKHRLFACEMMDKAILDCTKDNKRQARNRFFIKGDPEAILMLEIKADDKEDLELQKNALLKTINGLQLEGYGVASHTSLLYGEDIKKAFELRKAGLGVLANLEGKAKAVACIEDTAVPIEHLAEYIKDFTALMAEFDQKAIYYAHAGAGELHLRPVLDLKEKKDRIHFREISEKVARLVKKYNGSLSGEHGDGRVRAEFIPMILGELNYDVLKKVKNIFDPQGIFNPAKIVDAKPMDEDLRYEEGANIVVDSFLNFDKEGGVLSMAEKCNGSGDCRKLPAAGGGMCPSYRATLEEKDGTRARANILREILTHSESTDKYDSEELKKVYDLCVSCKACASECPSNVDAAILKAEFLHQYQLVNGRTWRDKMFANNYRVNKWLSKVKSINNLMMSMGFTSGIVKSIMGIAKERTMPLLSNMNIKRELNFQKNQMVTSEKKVYLFMDEFTTMMDAYLVVKSIELLKYLGYEILWIDHPESGRSFISKGFLPEAKKFANANIDIFLPLISEDVPLLGIEPSTILSFRDEYIRLAEDGAKAVKLAENVFLIEEFISREIDRGNIRADQFDDKTRAISYHSHCHQKALSSSEHTMKMLSLPVNNQVRLIESGCCGMAGSFGYEKEHYSVSMQMAELQLLPAIRKMDTQEIIVANGTSCRHQILDGVGRRSVHPIEVLWNAMLV